MEEGGAQAVMQASDAGEAATLLRQAVRLEVGGAAAAAAKMMMLDVLLLQVDFGKTCAWKAKQVAAFVTTMSECLLRCHKGCDRRENYLAFASAIKHDAVAGLFSLGDVEAIVTHACTTFFKHYATYQEALRKECPSQDVKVRLEMPELRKPARTLPNQPADKDEV